MPFVEELWGGTFATVEIDGCAFWTNWSFEYEEKDWDDGAREEDTVGQAHKHWPLITAPENKVIGLWD